MDQLSKLFAALSIRQRIGILFTAILAAAGIAGLVHWVHESDFHPLFTGMSSEDAAAVVQKLKETGIEYRIGQNGTSVLVPEAKVDEIRLELAAAGLPKTGRVGFELFDKTNLGVTDFTEHVNYRRALEGELERSIRSLSQLQQARVHITFPKDSVFLESREPAKASVLVDVRPGATLLPQNVAAITNLVASAVEGLNPDYVSVVDMQGNLLSRARKTPVDGSDSNDAPLEFRHQLEKDLKSKVEATLEPLLGASKFQVEVSADCDFSTVEQSDETFDPTRSVMVSSQRSEDLAGTPQPAGVPGTQSNTPRPTSRPVVTSSSVSRRTESTQYETTRTVRHSKTPQGALKRLSASVLIDQEVQWVGKGKQRHKLVVPPSAEKMKAIHDLVAGVLGIVPERGDQLIIETLPFEQTLVADDDDAANKTAPSPKSKLPSWLNQKVMIGGGAVLLIAVVAVPFLLRRKKTVEVEEGAKALPSAPATFVSAPDAAKPSDPAAIAKADAEQLQQVLQLPPVAKKVELLREHVKQSVKKDSEFTASVLRGWLDEDAH